MISRDIYQEITLKKKIKRGRTIRNTNDKFMTDIIDTKYLSYQSLNFDVVLLSTFDIYYSKYLCRGKILTTIFSKYFYCFWIENSEESMSIESRNDSSRGNSLYPILNVIKPIGQYTNRYIAQGESLPHYSPWIHLWGEILKCFHCLLQIKVRKQKINK